MMPLAAVMAVVILGASALAVDLTLQTHDRRTIQNVVDSAALAAAQDLIDPSGPASAVQAGRILAVVDAIKVLHTELGFPIPNVNYASQWAQSGASCVPGGSTCYADGMTAGEYTFSVDVPPKTSQNYGHQLAGPTQNYNGDSRYIEITLQRTTANPGFGGTIGAPMDTTGAHAIAFHQVPGIPFGFALYANTVVSTGNEVETVIGDTYAYRNINPQANGHAGYCAALNPDGSGGNIVLGSPQWPSALPPLGSDPAGGAPEQFNLAPNGLDPDVAHHVNNCADAQSGQLARMGGDRCPTSIQGVPLQSTWYFDDTYTKTCVASPPVTEPTMTGPTEIDPSSTVMCNPTPSPEYQPGKYACTGGGTVALTVDHTLAPGVYHISHNPTLAPNAYDVEIKGTPVAPDNNTTQFCPSSGYVVFLCGVTFILDANASIGVMGNSTTAVITPYVAGNREDNDGKFPVYSGYGVGGPSINVQDNSAQLVMSGTVYMPGGSMNVGQNAFVFIQGQAIVNTWNVQSGNHPNPDVLYDSNRVASEKELIRLVE